ncbi:glutamyl-tRNA amidotransferase [Cellulomonas sp. WB94]|uniref:GatB/YqeY domain-containing protein n=1 Tax=Cellulomonas sp. WB94 TaxID=2173174 RepID=UPI000D57F60C|nr:GatB/YqeY domain-containing protein [Cellulomonas sp. WB94]PVU83054.1 glutamyl-tRNA amidotransferase [Cellulomonas sp. WB94]
MTTLERLTADLTASMKARTPFQTNTLRQMIAAVRAAEKAGTVARELTEDQVQAVLSTEVKKRRESAQIYTTAGAGERAATETSEADLIESYLPPAVSSEQLDAIVADAIAATGATTLKDMGTVMKVATAAATGVGRLDGKALSDRVRSALTGAARA